jgi:hypothetical protein
MANILKEFISILASHIQQNFGTTGVIIQILGDIIYLGASCKNTKLGVFACFFKNPSARGGLDDEEKQFELGERHERMTK